MTDQISNIPSNNSSRNRDLEYYLLNGYSESEAVAILRTAEFLDAFNMNFSNGTEEFFDFRGER